MLSDKQKTQAFNPFLPSYEYIPDGEPYVFDDRIYIYGSHDAFNGGDYCVNNYVCWSAPVDDLGSWKYEGIIYKKNQDPMCDKEETRLLFAPDVQKGPDGRYYLYYVFDYASVVAVAVCDTPAGNYEFYGYVHYKDGTPLGQKEGDTLQFDPGVLVEGENVHLYTGFCPRSGTIPWELMGVKKTPVIKGAMETELEADMITIKRAPVVVAPYIDNSEGTSFEGHEFFEAPSMRKVRDKYYLIYSSIHGHELCYAISDHPDKEFVFQGTIISNGDIYYQGRPAENALNYYGNNHGSIVEIGEQWYVFYHRHTNKDQFSRQACAEKIVIDENGNIPQVEITSCGLNDGWLRGNEKYEARIACNLWGKNGAELYGLGDREIDETNPFFTQDGADREDDPGQYIANMTDGSVAGFKYFSLDEMTSITVEVRGTGTGEFRLSTEPEGKPIAVIPVETSDEWRCFKQKTEYRAEKAAFYFTFCGNGCFDFKSFELLCV